MRSAEDNSIDLLALKAKTVLDKQIVPFWTALKDPDFGGFYGQMDFDLTLQKTADKGVILQSRILWFFSELAMLTKSKKHIVAANHAFRFIAEHCFDDEFGGVYWSVTHDGKPSDTTKHTYAQSFALYALTSYYALSGNEKALDLSEQLLELIES